MEDRRFMLPMVPHFPLLDDRLSIIAGTFLPSWWEGDVQGKRDAKADFIFSQRTSLPCRMHSDEPLCTYGVFLC